MKKIIFFFVLLICLSFVLAVNHDTPPNLTNFQQLFGTVTGLPSGNFQVRVQIGMNTFVTAVESNGRYGYSPVLYVTGTNGEPVRFFVVDTATGAATEVVVSPQVTYQHQDVKPVNLLLGTASGTAGGQTDGGTAGGTSDSTGRSRSRDRASRSDSEGTVVQPSNTCLQSWDCQLWSDCQSGRQTRTCFRSDTCDQQLAAGSVLSITSIPKPSESQACISPTVSDRVCPPSSKRCLANSLQECPPDGQRWTTIRSCAGGCNSISLTCNDGAPVTRTPSIPWISIIVGGAAVLLVGFGLGIFLYLKNQKQYQPLKSYISEAKTKGLSNAQIKSTLIGQGWDAKKVGKLVE